MESGSTTGEPPVNMGTPEIPDMPSQGYISKHTSKLDQQVLLYPLSKHNPPGLDAKIPVTHERLYQLGVQRFSPTPRTCHHSEWHSEFAKFRCTSASQGGLWVMHVDGRSYSRWQCLCAMLRVSVKGIQQNKTTKTQTKKKTQTGVTSRDEMHRTNEQAGKLKVLESILLQIWKMSSFHTVHRKVHSIHEYNAGHQRKWVHTSRSPSCFCFFF